MASEVRRNLTPIQRVAIAEKYRPIYEKQAKENLKTSTGGSNPQGLPKSANPDQKINTRDAGIDEILLIMILKVANQII